MQKWRVYYNGKLIGFWNANTAAEVLAELVSHNPNHNPAGFSVRLL